MPKPQPNPPARDMKFYRVYLYLCKQAESDESYGHAVRFFVAVCFDKSKVLAEYVGRRRKPEEKPSLFISLDEGVALPVDTAQAKKKKALMAEIAALIMNAPRARARYIVQPTALGGYFHIFDSQLTRVVVEADVFVTERSAQEIADGLNRLSNDPWTPRPPQV